MYISNKKIFVLGAARSGIAGALLAKKYGANVFVSDSKNEDEIRDNIEILKQNGIEYETGKNSFEKIKEFDILIISPGCKLSEKLKIELQSLNIEIMSEIEFAYRFINIPIIAITGTNGKSTTTALIGHILNNSGISAFVGGNIGNALSNLVLEDKRYDTAVVEVSSFMLEDIDKFKPYITVFTNLSPDHMDRYTNYREYIDAKLNIFRNLSSDSIVVLNYDCPDLLKATDRFVLKKIFFSKTNNNTDIYTVKSEGGYEIVSVIGNKRISLHFDNPDLIGIHNLENTLASTATTLIFGVDSTLIEKGINTFKGLEHRIEFVREINGVKFYNDSKATNIDSASVALNSFEKGIIWIAGGRHKGSPYTQLSKLVRDRVKKIIVIGEAAPLIINDLRQYVEIENCNSDFEYAIKRAFESSERGDVVLLSPACSSYDMFTNYEERGRIFKEIVMHLGGDCED